MPNGFATYTRLNTVMQSVTNAKVAPSWPRQCVTQTNGATHLFSACAIQWYKKVMKLVKSASTNGGDACRLGEMQKLIH